MENKHLSWTRKYDNNNIIIASRAYLNTNHPPLDLLLILQPPTPARRLQAAAALVVRLQAMSRDPKLLADLTQVLQDSGAPGQCQTLMGQARRHCQHPFSCKSPARWTKTRVSATSRRRTNGRCGKPPTANLSGGGTTKGNTTRRRPSHNRTSRRVPWPQNQGNKAPQAESWSPTTTLQLAYVQHRSTMLWSCSDNTSVPTAVCSTRHREVLRWHKTRSLAQRLPHGNRDGQWRH